MEADYVWEATGIFLPKEKSKGPPKLLSKKVFMTGPPKDDTPMIVMGVNQECHTVASGKGNRNGFQDSVTGCVDGRFYGEPGEVRSSTPC